MPALFQQHVGVACRACGAASAAPDDEARFGSCGTCWGKFVRAHRSHELTELRFNSWLARQLYLNVRRQKIYGVAGRCEALTHWLYNNGFQCCAAAVMIRDGRRMCNAHGSRATDVAVIGDCLATPYDDFRELLSSLAQTDPQFLECLSDALEIANGLIGGPQP